MDIHIGVVLSAFVKSLLIAALTCVGVGFAIDRLSKTYAIVKTDLLVKAKNLDTTVFDEYDKISAFIKEIPSVAYVAGGLLGLFALITFLR
jgi:hypothetical protein